jgi:hypothetical protein
VSATGVVLKVAGITPYANDWWSACVVSFALTNLRVLLEGVYASQ